MVTIISLGLIKDTKYLLEWFVVCEKIVEKYSQHSHVRYLILPVTKTPRTGFIVRIDKLLVHSISSLFHRDAIGSKQSQRYIIASHHTDEIDFPKIGSS